MAAPSKKSAPTIMGRPEKYTQEWLAEEAKALREWVAKDGGLYIGSFARQRGYGRQRLSEFVEKNKDFADAMDEAQLWQEEKFLTKGLNREWDSAQVRYTMARVCGDRWKNSWDKEDKDVKSSDMLEFLASLMAQAKAKDKPDANSGT